MTTDTTDATLREHRISVFTGMGFVGPDAEALADAKDHDGWPLDTHRVRKAIRAGCSLTLALRIFS